MRIKIPLPRGWKWHDPDLHYVSVWDFYRRNVDLWGWNSGWAIYCVVFWILTGHGLWNLFWAALVGLSLFLIVQPRKTYQRVVVPHMASDREFLASLEAKGLPLHVAQDMLLGMEAEHLTPAQGLNQAIMRLDEWRARDQGFDPPDWPLPPTLLPPDN